MYRPLRLLRLALKVILLYMCVLIVWTFFKIGGKPYHKPFDTNVTSQHNIDVRNSSRLEYGKSYIYDYSMDHNQDKVEKIHQILYWTSSYMGKKWFGTGQEPFARCHYSNCNGTVDKEAFSRSDAVLFHLQFMKFDFEFPQRKTWKQKWIVFNHEPPPRAHFGRFNGIFNATMTYHRKSEIWANYSQLFGAKLVEQKDPETYKSERNFGKTKTKLVAWFVGDCGGYRRNYVRNLQKYIPVDVYGQCGPLKCKRTGMFNNGQDACNQMLDADYKFYLAFENCICEDYVTEKLWKALLFHTVPIVMGGYNYSEYLPSNAYINVKDYPSPRQLATYLEYLNQNNDAYNAYFDFHRHYKFERYPQWQCELCKYMNEAEGSVKVYKKMDEFWSREDQCSSPEEFYSKVQKESWN